MQHAHTPWKGHMYGKCTDLEAGPGPAEYDMHTPLQKPELIENMCIWDPQKSDTGLAVKAYILLEATWWQGAQ